MKKSELGELIKKLRKQRGLTQQDLAVNSALSSSSLSRIERGTVEIPSEDIINKLSVALGFDLSRSASGQQGNSTKMKAIGLFCGCGGLDLGFQQAGFDIVYANDILKSAEATYKHNVSENVEIRDYKEVDKAGLPDADVLLAGIPCQPFSNAGNRGGVKDERSNLFEEVVKTIDAKRPKVVLFENVRGFTSTKDASGVTMPERLRAEIAPYGYRLYYKLLNASDYEVPQNRYRVVLVGVRSDIKGDYQFPEPVPKTKELTIGSVLSRPLPSDEDFEAWPLSPQSLRLVEYIPEGGSWKDVPYELLPDRLKKIRSDMKKYRAPNFYRRFSREEIMGTVTAASTPENSGIIHPLENRRYSVREVARFQSFPDDFKFVGTSVSNKYKLIGNAVPVKLAYHVGTSIKEYLYNGGRTETVSAVEHGQSLLVGSDNRRGRDNGAAVDDNLALPGVGKS